MNPESRNSAIAAAIILLVFGLAAYYLPVAMRFVGQWSTVGAAVVGIAFVAAFFMVFWLRARSQRGK